MKTKNISGPILFLIITFAIFSCTSTKKDEAQITYLEEETQSVQFEYIAHACFILTHDEYSILIDPFADSTWISYTFPKDIEANVIFSTHPHYDHDGGIFRDLKPYWQGKIPFFRMLETMKRGHLKLKA